MKRHVFLRFFGSLNRTTLKSTVRIRKNIESSANAEAESIMISIFDRTFSLVTHRASRTRWVAVTILLIAFPAPFRPCRAQDTQGTSLPKVLMIEFQGSTPHDAGLYKAIRAQLSASPLILDRVDLAADRNFELNPQAGASRSATEYRASMVFWIEDKETCKMFFFIPDPSGGHISSRTLNLDLSSRPSRFEVIAVVAASMIEGLLDSRTLKVPPPLATKNPGEPLVVEKKKEAQLRNRFEILAAYSGAFWAADTVTHGISLGLGGLPIDRLVISASFTQNLPIRVENKEVGITVISRQIEVLAAFRILIHRLDIRLGVYWSIDLRSVSMNSFTESIDARTDGFMGVHSLVPFAGAAWVFSQRIGIFGRVGANLALNETTYKIKGIDQDPSVLDPFVAKLVYQLGLLVQF
jgi:hypothetical protein